MQTKIYKAVYKPTDDIDHFTILFPHMQFKLKLEYPLLLVTVCILEMT